jgi:2-oxoglutarate dehydrogenase E1 component
VHACLLAADWRARYSRDVVVDLVGYRRNGHNELDDPRETLPLTYRRISGHPTVLHSYARQLQVGRGLRSTLGQHVKASWGGAVGSGGCLVAGQRGCCTG